MGNISHNLIGDGNGDLPLVSVIVASYNHQDYIKECLLSILKQSYPNIELIVIDDGSEDNSVEIIKKLQNDYGFIFEIQENMGLAKTLNRAIGIARGKYIVSFGSDDVMFLDRIEKQVTFLEAHPEIDICGGNILVIDERGEVLRKQKIFGYRELEFEDLLTERKPGIPAPSAMVRASAFENEGGYDPEIPLEDMYMWFKLTNRGYRVAVLNDVLAYYRKHGKNTYKNQRYMLDCMLKTYEPYKTHEKYDAAVNKFLISIFSKASKTDFQLAMEVFGKISPKFYSRRVIKGFFKLLKLTLTKLWPVRHP